MALIDIVPEGLKSPELTGRWESKLYDIEKGKLRPEEYMAEIKRIYQRNCYSGQEY